MVMIVLKWLLAMLLTSVPFVFNYCIKPKAASSDKWRNFYCFLSARMPWLKRKALAVKAWVSYVYHKMYRSDNGRKFFTLVLVICMLVFQVVDFHAAKEACSFQVEWAARGKALSLTPYDIGLPGIDGEVELGPKSFMENILYPFQTSLWVYMVALMMTLLLFSYRLADRVLVGIHGSRCLQILLASLAIVVAVVDCGRAFLMSELIFILLMAGMVYPFKQLPPVPGMKSRWRSLGSWPRGWNAA